MNAAPRGPATHPSRRRGRSTERYPGRGSPAYPQNLGNAVERGVARHRDQLGAAVHSTDILRTVVARPQLRKAGLKRGIPQALSLVSAVVVIVLQTLAFRVRIDAGRPSACHRRWCCYDAESKNAQSSGCTDRHSRYKSHTWFPCFPNGRNPIQRQSLPATHSDENYTVDDNCIRWRCLERSSPRIAKAAYALSVHYYSRSRSRRPTSTTI